MNRRFSFARGRRLLKLLTYAGLCQFWGSCDIGQLSATTTTTTTLDTRAVIVTLVRAAIVTPLDNAITLGLNSLFDNLIDGDE